MNNNDLEKDLISVNKMIARLKTKKTYGANESRVMDMLNKKKRFLEDKINKL